MGLLFAPYNECPGLPFTDENQPPEPHICLLILVTPNCPITVPWAHLLQQHNHLETSAPTHQSTSGCLHHCGPSHFRQPPWNPQTPSPGQSFQFTAHQPPLSNTTNNSSHSTFKSAQQKHKQHHSRFSAKRRRTAAAPAEIETAPICGVGPSRLDPDFWPQPISRYCTSNSSFHYRL